jgi:TRAP-type C4-dicarboxylate transport system permease small subunit
MAAASFFALAYTFVEGGHIRITLFLEKFLDKKKDLLKFGVYSSSKFFFRIFSILFY